MMSEVIQKVAVILSRESLSVMRPRGVVKCSVSSDKTSINNHISTVFLSGTGTHDVGVWSALSRDRQSSYQRVCDISYSSERPVLHTQL